MIWKETLKGWVHLECRVEKEGGVGGGSEESGLQSWGWGMAGAWKGGSGKGG